MRFDLTCGTDAGSFAIYDPGAVLETEAQRGGRIAYAPGGDGEVRFRIFVDEPVTPELERRAEGRASGILRVPTGRLVASGVEHLVEDGAAHVIPAGAYEVTAFELGSREEETEEAERAARSASRAGAAVESVVGPLTGLVVVGSILGFSFLAGSVIIGDTTRHDVWAWTKAYGPWYLALWIVLVAIWKLAPVRKAMQARETVQAQHPDAVVHLRRLADTEDLSGRQGCVFGDGRA